MAGKGVQELVAWRKAMDLVEEVYWVTATFPKDEMYGLTSQLRRASVSVPSNIAERQARNTTRDFLHFLAVAYGSIKEIETQVLIAERLRYIDFDQKCKLLHLIEEVSRLTSGLANSLRREDA